MTQDAVNEWVASVLARQVAERQRIASAHATRSRAHQPLIFHRTIWDRIWPASFDARVRKELAGRR